MTKTQEIIPHNFQTTIFSSKTKILCEKKHLMMTMCVSFKTPMSGPLLESEQHLSRLFI